MLSSLRSLAVCLVCLSVVVLYFALNWNRSQDRLKDRLIRGFSEIRRFAGLLMPRMQPIRPAAEQPCAS